MFSGSKLVILDADGTTIDAFGAIALTFARHHLDIGDLERFQKRHNLFKYLGGAKEFPGNLKKQLGRGSRRRLIETLTEVYREEARLFPGMRELFADLIGREDVKVGVITRNITIEPNQTVARLFARQGIPPEALDFLIHLPLKQSKQGYFEQVRERFLVNPARSFVCGDEHKDYTAAVAAAMHPMIVSYGFENHTRLTQKFGVPEVLISNSPTELGKRLGNALA
jgi:phosphoglycolate phosphatase